MEEQTELQWELSGDVLSTQCTAVVNADREPWFCQRLGCLHVFKWEKSVARALETVALACHTNVTRRGA